MRLCCAAVLLLVQAPWGADGKRFSRPTLLASDRWSSDRHPIDRGARFGDEKAFQRHPPQFEHTPPASPRAGSNIDSIRRYTETLPSSVLVASAAAASVYLMLALFSNMVIGKLYNSPVIIAAAVLAIMSFFDGHVGDFSRAAGVMLLILIEKIKIGEFTLKLVQLVRSAIGISARRPFPPALNPWTYTPSNTDRRSEIGFRMRNALLGLGIVGLFFGYTISSWIPLLPNSIGALSISIMTAYIGTYRDGLGDLFRFFGSTIVAILSNTYAAANEVGLTVKLSALFGQLMAFYVILDQNFGLTAMVTSVLEKMYSIFSLVLSRFQGSSISNVDMPFREEQVRYAHMHPPEGRRLGRDRPDFDF